MLFANPMKWASPRAAVGTECCGGTWVKGRKKWTGVWLPLALHRPRRKLRVLLKSDSELYPEVKGLPLTTIALETVELNGAPFYQFLMLTIKTFLVSSLILHNVSSHLTISTSEMSCEQLRERCFWNTHYCSEKTRYHYLPICSWIPG